MLIIIEFKSINIWLRKGTYHTLGWQGHAHSLSGLAWSNDDGFPRTVADIEGGFLNQEAQNADQR